MKIVELYKPQGYRTDFRETWLVEMPSGSGAFGTFDVLEYGIRDLKKIKTPQHIDGYLFKIISDNVLYYWYEKDGVIQLATELLRKKEGLVVRLTGKNPKLKGKPPYASDLYSMILKDSDKSIRLMSDKTLSDEGYSMWKKLLKLGYNISIYNAEENPGQSRKSFQTPEEMDAFFKHDDTDFEKYQYVLSETLEDLAYVMATFNSRRAREIIYEENPRYPLEDS
jgi:hypothetical protein